MWVCVGVCEWEYYTKLLAESPSWSVLVAAAGTVTSACDHGSHSPIMVKTNLCQASGWFLRPCFELVGDAVSAAAASSHLEYQPGFNLTRFRPKLAALHGVQCVRNEPSRLWMCFCKHRGCSEGHLFVDCEAVPLMELSPSVKEDSSSRASLRVIWRCPRRCRIRSWLWWLPLEKRCCCL